MNRTEIEAKWNTLTPRERDAWVAEVVFGRTIMYEKRVGGNISVNQDGRPTFLSAYTSDISAAWSVVDYISDVIPCHFEITTVWPNPDNIKEYMATLLSASGNYRVETICPKATEAICLSAITAKLLGAR